MAPDDRPRRTRKSAGERAAEILDAATGLARAEGLAALTVRAVAERAGVTQGLVAHYFPSVHELVARVYRDVVGAEVAEVRDVVAAAGSPADRIRALLETVLDGSRDEVTVLWVEGWALGRANPALAVAVREQMDAWHALLATTIAEGVAAGALAVDDVDRAAWRVLAFVDGLNAQSLVREDAARPSIADAVASVEAWLRPQAAIDR
ncbi:TetR/AcrR family transcriptional regulator [Agrococcus sp. SGAir0287]|uniref:TetR/AcrR family transcriptional regulator n=1 Tax=Agrococcus sp. SGAir0287 TaxID=2070347 RepID=UPI0010CCB6E4|nr:TetR family transcriptional regulator C-terminal domain-containing protein [Agrococcus sp. SGAir0287]QCR19427.1 TetR family transcriptional regulator [Agrococcus sp. SGAir0287]